MFPTPLHPVIVHFPIVLMVFLPVVTAVVVWRLHDGARLRNWGLVIMMAALVTGSAFVAIRTGENEEEVVEDVVAEQPIHDHEEAAERFYLVSWIVLGLAVVGLVPGVTGRAGRLIALVGSLALVYFGVRVGDLGGKLAYQHGAAGAYVESANRGDGGPRAIRGDGGPKGDQRRSRAIEGDEGR